MPRDNEVKNEPLFDNLANIEWLSIEDASNVYPISMSTFYKYKLNGIPVRKLGRKLIVKRSELEEWLERWTA